MTGRPRLRRLTADGLAAVTGVEIDGVLYDVRLIPRTPPEPVPVPNVVRIGSATWPLAAVNPVRGPGRDYEAGRATNEIVFYTAPTTVTETNIHGWEVPVGADGRVAGPGRVNRTPVPPDGGVLSGHYGPTRPRAGEWLRTHAVPGALVELIHEETEPPTGTLPGWVTAAYWQQYEGPSAAIVSRQGYNLVWAAFATGGGGQRMVFDPGHVQDPGSFAEQVREAQDSGVVWGLSIGGGVKAAEQTLIRTKAEAEAVFRGLKPIIDRYGFQGVDDDLENGPGGFTLEGLRELFRLLRGEYGPGFVLASTPRPYEKFRVGYAAELYADGLLDVVQWQLYDSMEYRDSGYLRRRALDEIDAAARAGIPASAQVIGAITLRGYDKGWNTIDVYEAIIAEARTTRGVRGGFVWHAGYDQDEGWSFARRIEALGA